MQLPEGNDAYDQLILTGIRSRESNSTLLGNANENG
jgi:hypothetical protein